MREQTFTAALSSPQVLFDSVLVCKIYIAKYTVFKINNHFCAQEFVFKGGVLFILQPHSSIPYINQVTMLHSLVMKMLSK